MLKANQAVRLGLRAASRNPELAFGKGLLDQAGTLLSFLPVALVVVALIGLSSLPALQFLVESVRGLQRAMLPLAGVVATLLVLGWSLGAAFWAGALPLLAADAELGRRPPEGHFFPLAGRGFARVVAASIVAGALSALVHVVVLVSVAAGILAFATHQSLALGTGVALVAATGFVASFLADLLARLALVRAAVFADGPAASLGRAASLLGERLPSLLGIWAAFLVLELIVGTASAAIGGSFSSNLRHWLAGEIVAIAPRLALGFATGVVLSWVEVARHAALAAVAADAEGLIEPEPPPVVDALPVETIVEALPAGEPVIEALPFPEPPKE